MNEARVSRKEANVHITHGATNRYEKVQTCSIKQDDYTNLNISVCTECYIRLTMLKIRRRHKNASFNLYSSVRSGPQAAILSIISGNLVLCHVAVSSLACRGHCKPNPCCPAGSHTHWTHHIFKFDKCDPTL